MLILETNNIKKYFGDRLIINLQSLKIYHGDRIGIVGQNGVGKSTLLNILAGKLLPDEGSVQRYCSTAYIKQLDTDEEMSVPAPKLASLFSLPDNTDTHSWSGGEQTRLKLARAFSEETALLFADEPTANLDCQGIELLKSKLHSIFSMLLISHDRELLDIFCNKIIDIENGVIKLYSGNYSAYKAQRILEHKQQQKEYDTYLATKKQLKAAITNRKSKAKGIKKAPARMGNSEARLHKRASTKKEEKLHNAANSLITRLEKLDVKERPYENPHVKIDLSLTNPPANKIIVSVKNLSFAYPNRSIFRNTNFQIYNRCKTAIYGKNGIGKSTLLNIICQQNYPSVKTAPQATLGYLQQCFEHMNEQRTVLENVMSSSVQSETVARTILARLLMPGDNVHKKVGLLSGGEKIKTSFAKLFVSAANVLLLDEPTNFLDIASVEALEDVLSKYEGTVIFVSHDKAFINTIADRLLIIENHCIQEHIGTLAEWEEKQMNTPRQNNSALELSIMQMRIADITAKLSSQCKNRQDLEHEYQRLVHKIRLLS